nr:TipAS antibiotic-recognition domain-containing protein [Paenibacillus sp. SYP-B3998]
MKDEELYKGFDTEKQAKYEQEIIEKHGSKTLDESKNKTGSWSKEDYEAVQSSFEKLHKQFAVLITQGAQVTDEEVQQLVGLHFGIVSKFYTPTKEVYQGLGHMYVESPDFKTMYDNHHPQLAEFLRDAMKVYADTQLL